MIIETHIDFKRYVKLMFLLTYRKPMMIILTIIGFVMICFLAIDLIQQSVSVDFSLSFPIIFIFAIIVTPINIYRSSKKMYFSHAAIQGYITYEFTEEKIQLSGDTFNSVLDWSKIYKIVEMKNWVLIYHSIKTANFLPKESFGDNIVEFRELVKSKHIKSNIK